MKSYIPTPTTSILEVGPLTIHFYALCIISGIAVAIWLGDKRFRSSVSQGARVVSEVAISAVPSGIVGGRLYHVITSPAAYFGDGGRPIEAFKIWNGGLGIWGAISLGAVGALLRYRYLDRKYSLNLPSFLVFMDAVAPGIALAQALGRIGNWFNGELFGRPLDAPWALEIPFAQRPAGYTNFETFHPTFAYESLWCIAIAALILVASKKLKDGQSFALYVALYCVGRFFIEAIRIDSANTIAGLRLNLWVALLVGASALVAFRRFGKALG